MKYKYFTIKELIIHFLSFSLKPLIQKCQQYKYLETVKSDVEKLLNGGFKILRDGEMFKVVNSNLGYKESYKIRIGTSDHYVLDQVIKNEEYLPIIKIIELENSISSIKFIVDAGSNIGLSSIFFSRYFPEATILAIEPDETNYIQQNENILLNKIDNRVTSLKRALWINNSDNLILDNSFRDGNHWSRFVRKSNGLNNIYIKTITIEDIINRYSKSNRIDILKMDIEGAEAELFKSERFISVLYNNVRYFCVEVHHEFISRTSIIEILKMKFSLKEEGETIFCSNINLNGRNI